MSAARRIIVCGSRRWHDRELIADTLAIFVEKGGYRFPSPIIVHGEARGADKIAAEEAGKAGLLTEAHPANWSKHGKVAGFLRNEEMAALGADCCIAFWDGKSTGTKHMIDTAARYKIPVVVIREKGSKP